MRASVPRLELLTYSTVWVVIFAYSFYRIHHDGIALQLTTVEPRLFSPARFAWLPAYRDSSDYDWDLWTRLLRSLAPWIALHLVVAETTRYFDSTAIPVCHAVITFAVLVVHLPLESSLVLISTLVLFLFALLIRSKLLTWFLAVGSLLSLNVFFWYFYDYSYHYDYDDITMTVLCFEWILLKCIDFTLTEIKSNRSFLKKFMDLMGYTFYLPCFFLGPFVPYDAFKASLYRDFQPWSARRVLGLIKGLVLTLFWASFFELSTHFFYCHAMHTQVTRVVSLGLWTMHGVGLCMAQFFFIKYIVVYGGSLSIARAELYEVPPNPKCVNRIHLYSNMWRHFDRGFYLFLMRCIYKPICASRRPSLSRKLFATFFCFCFVLIWHGINQTIMIWSTMNFVGICLESAGNAFLKTQSFKTLDRILGPVNMRRLEAIVCSPLWVMAVVSNYSFFVGYELGTAYVSQLRYATGSVLLFMFLMGYCMCHVSIEVINREYRSKTHLHLKS